MSTREICKRCRKESAVGFTVPDETWMSVAGVWRHGVLCLACFTEMGDEKLVRWELGLQFWPVSLRMHIEDEVENGNG